MIDLAVIRMLRYYRRKADCSVLHYWIEAVWNSFRSTSMRFLVHQFRSIDLCTVFSTLFLYRQVRENPSTLLKRSSAFTSKLVKLSVSKVNLLETNKDIAPLGRENLQTFVYMVGYEHQHLYIFATLFRSYICARF